MNDDQLRAELERRGSRVAAPDLLPAISPRLNDTSRPARVARWAPLAGLVGAGVIVLVLIVAFPGGVPLSGSPKSSASSQPSVLQVMSQDAFASALERDALAGQTVLVNGDIVAYDGPPVFGGYCGPNGPPCILGQLEDVQPRVTVFGPDLAVASSADSSLQQSSGWPWWKRVTPPIHGTLVLSVNQTGKVEYVGRAAPGTDGLTSVAADLKNLDASARDLDEVVLVNAWLTGLDVPALCAVGGPSAIPGLLRRTGCGQMSWLADEPAAIDPQSQLAPSSALQVQPLAYRTYAADPSAREGASLLPQRAVYALARRLYGEGCIDLSAPCWDWSIVGRLSQPAPVVAPPSVPTVPTSELEASPTAVPLPTGRELNCANDMTLVDTTGLAESCELQTDSCFPPPWGGCPVGLTVSSTQINAKWVGAMCQPDVRASFQRSGDEYDLAISEESPPVPSAAPSCAGGPLELSFTLTLGAPVRGSVQATVNGQDLPVSAPQSPTLGELTCADNITLVDATRLVTSCSDAGVVDYHSQDPKTSNPSSDPNRLHLWWGSDTCVVDRRIDFAATADGGYLATVTESDLAGCNPMPEAWSIDLDFASPIAADKVYVNAVFPHTPFAPTTSTIKCSALAGQGAGGITLTDETGLVVSCASVAGDTSSGDFTVANPGNDFRQDLLQWWGGPCDGSPSVAFSKSSRGYLVQLHLAPLCQPTQRDHVFGLLLNMNSDVDVGSAGATFEETRGATD